MKTYKLCKSVKKKLLCVILILTVIAAGCGKKEKINKNTAVNLETDDETTTFAKKTEDAEKDTETPVKSYKNVTLSFTGDIYLSDVLFKNYTDAGNSIEGFLSHNIVENFKNADLLISDHEYACTDLPDDARVTYQLYNFKAPESREFIWKEMGVDVVTLANNHTYDYGVQSLLDTMETLNNIGVKYIGAGKNLKEAGSPYITEINGKKIAILGSSRFVPQYEWYATEDKPGIMTTYESTDRFNMIKDEIKKLKQEENCDFVVVYVHFGTEKSNQINTNQPVIAHGYIDSGADLVVGTHAHTLQGIEIYNGKPIYYGMSNFLFGNYKVDTMVLNVTINEDNSCNTWVVPCISQLYKTTDVTGSEAERILKYLEEISVNVSVDESGNVTEGKQVR